MKGYRFFKQKAYFDKGMDILNYGKYVIAALGIALDDIRTILYIVGVFAIVAYIVGYIWFKFEFVDAETEVYNRANPFVKEMRDLSGTLSHRKV